MYWRYFRSIPMTWVGIGFMAPGVAVLALSLVFANWADLKGTERRVLPLSLFGLGSAFFFPGLLLFSRAMRELHRRVAALRDGARVHATVNSITHSNVTVNNRSYLHINWTWHGSDGERGEGRTPPLSPEHASRWRPGDQITAFRHPQIPFFAEADVYGFRSVVPAPRPRESRVL